MHFVFLWPIEDGQKSMGIKQNRSPNFTATTNVDDAVYAVWCPLLLEDTVLPLDLENNIPVTVPGIARAIRHKSVVQHTKDTLLLVKPMWTAE